MAGNDMVELATDLTIAWLANPNTRAAADEVQPFLVAMHRALGDLGGADPVAEPAAEHPRAISVRRSLASPDRIVSMIDGKPYSSLKRHLKTHGLTPEEYRERYGLKPDYPMVAPGYSELRRAVAQSVGLGRKAGEKIAKEGAKKASRGIAAAKQAAKTHLGGGSRG